MERHLFGQIPLLLVAAITLGYPCYFIYRTNRRSRRLPSGCIQCNYDLTGNESGVCPECGKAVEVAA